MKLFVWQTQTNNGDTNGKKKIKKSKLGVSNSQRLIKVVQVVHLILISKLELENQVMW